MHIRSKYRLRVLGGILAFGLATTSCDDTKQDTGDNNIEGDTTSPDPGKDVGPDISEETDVQIIAGFMNGAWKLADSEDDAVVAYFDLTQVEGNPAVGGGYLTGIGLYDGLLEGGVGALAESSFDGTTLTIQWNPTTQDVEMLRLSATKLDDDTFSGTITAVQNVGLDLAVQLTREADAPGH